MPKPWARRAMACPIRPSPMMPSVVAVHVGAHQLAPVDARPLPGADEAVALGDAARHAQHERPRHVGRGLGQHARRVRDEDAAPGRRSDVDDVVAHGGDRHDAEAGRGGENRLGDRMGAHRDDRLDVGDVAGQLGDRQLALGVARATVPTRSRIARTSASMGQVTKIERDAMPRRAYPPPPPTVKLARSRWRRKRRDRALTRRSRITPGLTTPADSGGMGPGIMPRTCRVADR